MTLQQKIAQSFFPAAFINDTEENIQKIESLIQNEGIGGLTFFHSRASAATNYEANKKVQQFEDSFEKLQYLINRYQSKAKIPLLIAIDAEWGLAMRVEKTPQYPYAISLGALPYSQINLVYEVGKQIGFDLKKVGIHYNLAPLADCNTNPLNPVIGYRSFGENKEKVAQFALEYLKGMNQAGVLGCLKHFPGHGNTLVDSHLGLPILNENLEELLETELYPFIKAIKQGIDSIMIGHLAVPALNDGKNISATLSKSIIKDLLKKQLGFDGVVISDALNMKSVADLYSKKGQLEWEAFDAGNDILCFSEHTTEGIQEILKNASETQIETTYQRVLQFKQKANILSKNNNHDDFDLKKTTYINTKIAQNTLTKIKDNAIFESTKTAFESKSLACLSICKTTENTFFNTLSEVFPAPKFSIDSNEKSVIDSLKKQLTNFEVIIIALFVPKVKPQNNFEIPEEILVLLGDLLKNKKIILFNFGNPYSLKIVPNFKQAIGLFQVYQDFEPFQENAAKQFNQNSLCKGISPVNLGL
jgi:beta-N-acetylhexosaminidase